LTLHVVRPGEGYLGPLRVLAGGAQTRGRYFALEWETPPSGRVDPPHSHETYAESEFVLTGEREILVDDHGWTGGPGLFVIAPPRCRHTMRTVGDAKSRWLHFFSPGGMEDFMAERRRLQERGAPLEEIGALRERFGTRAAPSIPPDEHPAANVTEMREGVVFACDDYSLALHRSLTADAHVHDQDEAFYVIEGTLHIDELIAGARSFVLVPHGVRHRHAVDGLVLAVYSPGPRVPH
jgi:quercetin dioxygenase-like cupin family protein